MRKLGYKLRKTYKPIYLINIGKIKLIKLGYEVIRQWASPSEQYFESKLFKNLSQPSFNFNNTAGKKIKFVRIIDNDV